MCLFTADWFSTLDQRATGRLVDYSRPLTTADALKLISFCSVFFPLLPFQEGAGEDIPIMLLGNKTDKEIERQVQKGVGERLAKVCLCFILLSSKFCVNQCWLQTTVTKWCLFSSSFFVLNERNAIKVEKSYMWKWYDSERILSLSFVHLHHLSSVFFNGVSMETGKDFEQNLL